MSSCQLSMGYLKPLLGYTGVWPQHVQSLTTTYFSTPLRNSPYTQLIRQIVPSLPAHPVSWTSSFSNSQILGLLQKITGKCRLELLLLEAGPDSQGAQCAQRCLHSSLENLHSPCGLLCYLTLLSVPFFLLYVHFECPFSSPG